MKGGEEHRAVDGACRSSYDARNSVSMTTSLTVQPSFHLRSLEQALIDPLGKAHLLFSLSTVIMSNVHPSSSSLGGTESDKAEQPMATANKQPSMPEDGYGWNKYGQKYIKNVGKIRSYYRCRRKECKARKRLEWSPANPAILRVVYDGTHDHRPPSDVEQVRSVDVNQYELRNQVLGHLNGPHQV